MAVAVEMTAAVQIELWRQFCACMKMAAEFEQNMQRIQQAANQASTAELERMERAIRLLAS